MNKLHRMYDTFAITGMGKTVKKQSDGSYRPVGWKGQITGYIAINLFTLAVMHVGRIVGREEAQADHQQELFVSQIRYYDEGVNMGRAEGCTQPHIGDTMDDTQSRTEA